jgi:hypothetical protein
MTSSGCLTLTDLMAAVGAAGLGLAWVHWDAPGRAEPALIVIGPLVGILWHRWLGGRGVLGGALGGAAYAGLGLLDLVTGPHGPGRPGLSDLRDWPVQVIGMTTVCVACGTGMGVVAWLWATAMGRPRTPEW